MVFLVLEGGEAAAASHAELEQRVSLDGPEVQRLVLQGHFDLRAAQRVDEGSWKPDMSGCWPPSLVR